MPSFPEAALTTVRPAHGGDLEALARLFEAYRAFYKAPPDAEAARRFLSARLELGDSRLFLALRENRAIGFTQLYPSFSSLSMQRLWILNDLFVAPEARGGGAGTALMAAAAEFARTDGAKGLVLATQVENLTAQSLYHRMGYRQDSAFLHFQLIF
jgi:GNAT superfamily N-acetyltransferase